MQPNQAMPEPLRRVFIDTQGWVEMFHAVALHHAQALQFLQDARAYNWTLLTSNMILSELTPLLRSRNFRLPQPQILDIITRIRALPGLVIVHVDAALDEQAWDLLYANKQHPWSHVDATSMAIMRHMGISDILTADHHFSQAGFTVLLHP